MIFSLCVVYILRATSSSPTLLQPRAVSPGVGAVLQSPHKASRRPHSHSSGPGLIPSFPDLFQVHYMYCTLGCSFVGLCVRNVRTHMQNCVCVYVHTYGHTCTCHFSNSICRCEILYSTLSMHIKFLHYNYMLFTGHEYPHFLWA